MMRHLESRPPRDGTKQSRPPRSFGPPLGADLKMTLEDYEQKHLLRRLRTLSHPHGTHAKLEGRDILLFCGNDYLGLSQDPRVIQAAVEALRNSGAGSGAAGSKTPSFDAALQSRPIGAGAAGSKTPSFDAALQSRPIGAGAARLISGTGEWHERLEKELAAFKGTEAALVYGSGYLTNLGVLSALAGEKDLILLDKLCHASLIDGARLSGATMRVYPHGNLSRLESILKNSSQYRQRFIVTDSVFSMDGDWADLAGLAEIKKRYEAQLIVDEAHAIGIFGENGRGAAEHLGVEKEIDVSIGTLSKALGVFGGFAAARRTTIDSLINFSRPFIFATAPPTALMAAASKALEILRAEPGLRQKLWRNVDWVIRLFACPPKGASPLKGDWHLWGDRQTRPTSPIIPIMMGEEKRAVEISEALLKKGILIPAIRYPTVAKGKARLRLTVSAAHTEEDLEKLLRALKEVLG